MHKLRLPAFLRNITTGQGLSSMFTDSTVNSKFPTELGPGNIDEFLSKYDTLLLDMDGVLWHADHITKFSGISDAVTQLREHSKKLFFVTNNSMHSRNIYVKKLREFGGFEADKSDIFCVSYAAAIYLKDIAKIKGKCYVIGNAGIEQELNEIGVQNFGVGPDPHEPPERIEDMMTQPLESDVEAVLVGYDMHFNYNKMFKASSYLIKESCHFLSTNCMEMSGLLAPDRRQPFTGAISVAVTASAKRKPIVLGKPYRHMMDCLLAKNPDINLKRTLMVGDSLKTDIGFAKEVGIDSLLVLSGVTQMDDLRKAQQSCSPEMQNVIPDYYLSKFGDFSNLLSL